MQNRIDINFKNQGQLRRRCEYLQNKQICKFKFTNINFCGNLIWKITKRTYMIKGCFMLASDCNVLNWMGWVERHFSYFSAVHYLSVLCSDNQLVRPAWVGIPSYIHNQHWSIVVYAWVAIMVIATGWAPPVPKCHNSELIRIV